VSNLKSIIAALNKVDWDFPGGGTEVGSIHNIHWYPGNFIPQIPEYLVQSLSMPNALVFDPFSGSGTTAVEAVKLRRRAISSDRNPMSALITKAKLSLLQHSFDQKRRSDILSKVAFDHECFTDEIGQRGEGSNVELTSWFSPRTLGQLRFIWKIIERCDPPTKDVLLGIFSNLLFSSSSPGNARTKTGKRRRHHWGWIADNVVPKETLEWDAIALFRGSIHQLPTPTFHGDISSFVLQQDARAIALKDETVDLIVTSPPYIGVIDYTRANRLTYNWMGWPLDEDRESEIGARSKRGRKSIESEYIQEIVLSWKELHRVLRSGAYCAIVIGESRKFPGTAAAALRELDQIMPMVWGPTPRRPTRRRVSARVSSDAIEYVCIFRKPIAIRKLT
jgi:DNA methylase